MALVLVSAAGTLLPAQPVKAAKTKTVYMVKSIKGTSDYGGRESYTYSYNEDGLTAKCKTVSGTIRYTYKNGLLVKMKDTPKKGIVGLSTSTTVYTYDKKNRIRQSVTTEVDEDKTTTSTIDYYYNKKSQLKKQVMTEGKEEVISTYRYNSKGQISRFFVENKAAAVSLQTVYKYDDKGNLIKSTSTYDAADTSVKSSRKYTLTYKKSGRLTKKVMVSSTPGYPSSSTTYTVTYEKVKVPKANLERVQQEQWKILNENMLSY